LLPLKKHRRPEAVSKIARPPIFGRDLYDLLGKSKIVLNGAIDMAGNDRGNMRCFEAMGCGALLMSDEGRYPEGMIAEETIVTYKTNDACLERLRGLLAEWNAAQRIASDGRSRISGLYTKERQWASFEMIVANL
jgi:spore maturation protein CgeB